MTKSANAHRCTRYRDRLNEKGIRQITLLAPTHSHEELRRLAKNLRQGRANKFR